jgi:peptidyl-prolyl cis-trans isomerase C
MPNVLKDPLLHFLVLGGALFLFLSMRGGSPEPSRIYVGPEQIERLARAQLVIDGRGLRPQSIEEVVDAYVRDEIYYREALALGLDGDDDQVRTRLIEKMRYLSEDLADPEPASETDLRAFYDANPELFVHPATVSFDHVFFSPSQRGSALGADVEAALAHLRDGAPPESVGDRTPLGTSFEAAPAERLRVLFGDALTEAVFDAPLGEWLGPFESDFGLHVVRLTDRTEASRPAFEAIRDEALELYAADQRRRRNEAAFAAMRARYDVVIEWPDAEAGP